MKITIISIGKFKQDSKKNIFNDYLKRIEWKLSLKEIEVKEALTGDNLKNKEGQLIIKNIPSSSKIILLDEKGKNITSIEFSKIITNNLDMSYSNLVFIIGGANGVCESVKKIANITLSFGKITIPHMMVRLILIEQIYRSYTIFNNHPYHRS